VFLNAFNPAEPGHAESNRFLDRLRALSAPIIVPTLVFPEVAATISRVRGDATLARSFASALRRWPNMITVALDNALARQAVDAAAQYRLRGSDSVYVAVAIRFATILVTLDREQQQRASGVVTACLPADALQNAA
jgi:predicted nucleic acid-binding protein